MEQQHNRKPEKDVGRTVRRLLVGVVLMFGFGFALVPLYDVFCDITGINGRTDNQRYEFKPQTVVGDVSRDVRIQFVALNNSGMPWEFRPHESSIIVHPGEAMNTHFFARNTAGRAMVAQAIPSVSPSAAAAHFKKIECFCFEQQPLKAGESSEMGLRFFLDPALPDDIRTITLSYTLFDVTDMAEEDRLKVPSS